MQPPSLEGQRALETQTPGLCTWVGRPGIPSRASEGSVGERRPRRGRLRLAGALRALPRRPHSPGFPCRPHLNETPSFHVTAGYAAQVVGTALGSRAPGATPVGPPTPARRTRPASIAPIWQRPGARRSRPPPPLGASPPGQVRKGHLPARGLSAGSASRVSHAPGAGPAHHPGLVHTAALTPPLAAVPPTNPGAQPEGLRPCPSHQSPASSGRLVSLRPSLRPVHQSPTSAGELATPAPPSLRPPGAWGSRNVTRGEPCEAGGLGVRPGTVPSVGVSRSL